MHPLPSLSYILNVHLSLCSSLPLRTKFKAATYSRKSMVLSCKREEKELKCYKGTLNSGCNTLDTIQRLLLEQKMGCS